MKRGRIWPPSSATSPLTIPPPPMPFSTGSSKGRTPSPNHPHAFRKGRLPGTREMVIHPHDILIYATRDDGVTILRLLHSARNWP